MPHPRPGPASRWFCPVAAQSPACLHAACRFAVDKTGLHGAFDVDLDFAADDALAAILARGLPGSIPSLPAN